jgi:hypothetical protein
MFTGEIASVVKLFYFNMLSQKHGFTPGLPAKLRRLPYLNISVCYANKSDFSLFHRRNRVAFYDSLKYK